MLRRWLLLVFSLLHALLALKACGAAILSAHVASLRRCRRALLVINHQRVEASL